MTLQRDIQQQVNRRWTKGQAPEKFLTEGGYLDVVCRGGSLVKNIMG